MIRYQLDTDFGFVYVELPATEIEQTVKLSYRGNKDATATVQRWLSFACGIYGHQIGEATTPLDLSWAMRSQQAAQFQPVLLEGEDILEQEPTSLPPGAIP